MTSGAQRSRFAVVLALAVLAITAPRLLLHEPWRDEAWLWLVAIESPSLPDLVHALGRTGQGYLFPLLSWLVAQLSHSFVAMQALNLAITAAGVYVLARWSPLRPLECALVALGYYVGYEYAVLSRHYALGMLLLFAACAAARARASPIVVGAALALLFQTTVYAWLVGVAIACGVAIERISRRDLPPLPRREVLAGVAIALAGAVAGIVQVIPEAGTPFAVGWHFDWDPKRAIETLQMPWRAFLPLVRPQREAWNSDVLGALPGWRALAGVASLALGTALLWPRKLALAVFGIGVAGLLAFGYVKYVGSMRHHGHVWLLFIAAVWLAGGLSDAGNRRSWREHAFLALLTVHVATMAIVSAIDLRHPFSNGVRTAALIRELGFDRYPLLGYREPPATTVSLALGLPMYAPSRGVFATHTDWGPLQRDIFPHALRCAARALAAREHGDIVLVMNKELPAWPEIQLAGARTGAMVPTENYFLYRLLYGSLARSETEAACAPGPT